MKTIYYFVLSIALLSCTNTNGPEETELKAVDTAVIESAEIIDQEWTYIDSVRMNVYTLAKQCDQHIPTKIIDEEKWTYCAVEGNLEMAYLEKKSSNVLYKEEYVLKDGQLIYAFEVEETSYENDTIYWSCEYILNNQKVVAHSSLGHGETETDNWEPESIIAQWKSHKNNFLEVKTTANTK